MLEEKVYSAVSKIRTILAALIHRAIDQSIKLMLTVVHTIYSHLVNHLMFKQQDAIDSRVVYYSL